MKYFYIHGTIIAIAIFLTAFLPTYTRVNYLKEHKKELEKEIEALEKNNREIEDQIKALKKDPYFLELMVRKKFRMVREGEVLLK